MTMSSSAKDILENMLTRLGFDAAVEETALHIGHGARRVSALKLCARSSLATDEFLRVGVETNTKAVIRAFWLEQSFVSGVYFLSIFSDWFFIAHKS